MANLIASDETYGAEGVVVKATHLYDDGTATDIEGSEGKVRQQTPTEADRVAFYLGRVPLDDLGALATLLSVKGTISVKDAAAIANTTEAKIIAEAEAWAIPTKPVAPKP